MAIIQAMTMRWGWAGLLVAAMLAVGMQTYRLAREQAAHADTRVEVATLKQAVAEAQALAAQQTAALQSQVTKAQDEARTRERALRVAAAAAATESDGLRADVEALRGQLAEATREAAVERATAIGAVLQQCAARHQDLAQRCDRHVNDIRTLIDAWPVN